MPSEDPRLEETADGFQVHYQGRRLYSPSGPRTGALRRAETVPLPENTLFLVPSPLLGYGLEQLLSRLPASSHLFCVELDPALSKIAEGPENQFRDACDITFHLNSEEPPHSVAGWRRLAKGLLTGSAGGGYRRVRTVSLNGGSSHLRGAYRNIENELGEAIQQTWQNRMTTIQLGRVWARNFLVNLGATSFARDAATLRDPRPIMIVGPSESLEENGDIIRRLGTAVAVLAVDTSLPILRSVYGVVPDYVVSVDSQRANALDFLGSDSGEYYRLIADTTVHPSIPRLVGEGRTYWFSSGGFDTALVRSTEQAGLLPTKLPPVGSVAVAAVLLALRMTKAPVYLLGIDLAYTPGKPYARGAPLHLEELSETYRLAPERMYGLSLKRPLTRADNGGGASIPTDLVLLSYRHQLGSLLAGTTRVWRVGDRGLSLGIPVKSPSALEHEIGPSTPSGPLPTPGRGSEREPEPPSWIAWRREQLDSFLRYRLKTLREAIESPRPTAEAARSWDHAWFDFPEAQTDREPGPTFAPRLLLRLRRYERILKRLLSRPPG